MLIMCQKNYFRMDFNLNDPNPKPPTEETQGSWDDFGDIVSF
jgi:hypothetical protein